MNNLVSIIIPHYNNETILLNCLKSIYESTYKNFEIIVVDNASTDNSIINAKSLYPNINIVKSESNLGYAGGCNLGSKEAKHREMSSEEAKHWEMDAYEYDDDPDKFDEWREDSGY